jgi:hypothetical protein
MIGSCDVANRHEILNGLPLRQSSTSDGIKKRGGATSRSIFGILFGNGQACLSSDQRLV